MHIYLIDKNINTINAWSQYFSENPDFTVFHGSFDYFMQTHKVDCIVSPANSYGLMDGGYDLAITEWFGPGLMSQVQSYILEHFRGEQPIGSSILIPAFGGGCGDVSPETIAYMMNLAYNQVMNPPTEITWNYAERCYPEFYEDLLR